MDESTVSPHLARIFKTGNSLAVRIPSVIARSMDFQEGSPVEVTVSDGVLALRKAASRDLTALLERITPENVHGEQFGELAGNEVW